MNSNSLDALLSMDIQDPTQFPEHSKAPGVRSLDSSLRCTICSEFFQGPVTLPCGHCFCSFCLRDALAVKQECPSCRTKTIEAHIRVNSVVEEIVTAWKDSRPLVLQMLKDLENRASTKETSRATLAKKRKRSAPEDSDTEIECIPGPSRLKGKAPLSTKGSMPQSPKKKSTVSGRSSDSEDEVPTSDINEDDMHNLEPDLVKCPVCAKKVAHDIINSHLDNNCAVVAKPQIKSRKDEWSKIMSGSKILTGKGKNKGKERASSEDDCPLPKVSYGTLKDRQIRELLADQDLPVTGDCAIWKARYSRWIMLYNANLDKAVKNRQTKSELRKELKLWEDQHANAKKKQKAVDDADIETYQKKNKNEFAKLIDAARPKKKPTAPLPDGGGTSSPVVEASASSPGGVPESRPPSSPPPRRAQPRPTSASDDEDVIVVDSEEERVNSKARSGS